MNAFSETWEEGVPRVTAGCVNRVAKLKALGNSLVPQCALQIFLAIETGEIEVNANHSIDKRCFGLLRARYDDRHCGP